MTGVRGNRFSPDITLTFKITKERRRACRRDQSFEAAGAGVAAAGASWIGAGLAADFCPTCFLAEAYDAAAAGRGDGGAVATGVDAGCDVVPVPGSGVMMLMGGVDAAEGKSALVGLPVGIVGARAATGAGIAAGVFQNGEYRAIRPS